LGIRNLRVFNLALLRKWRWKISNEVSGMWYRTLVNKYGIRDESITVWGRGSSTWWKDIFQLDIGGMESSNSYSVKDAYRVLMFEIRNFSNPLWAKAWHKSITSKVSCLVWTLFQNRDATKHNLFKRGAIGQGSLQCVG